MPDGNGANPNTPVPVVLELMPCTPYVVPPRFWDCPKTAVPALLSFRP
jgi:hypothetical protein